MLKRLALRLFPSLPYLRAEMEHNWREIETSAAVIGWPAAIQLWLGKWSKAPQARRSLRRVRLPGYRHPLYFRPGASDAAVMKQIFVRREYARVAHLPGVEYIIDCGANIGCTTAFLLHHHPEARAVVVEPDAGNMSVCRKNLAPFRGRVTFAEAGLWSSPGPLTIERGTYRDGSEWSFQVRPSRPGETPDVTAVTVQEVMALAGFPRIDLLKMDIEGAEVEVMASGTDGWLPKTRNLVIEIHDEECERVTAAALASYRWVRETHGELSCFLGLGPLT